MKDATPEQLRLYKKTTKGQVITIIKKLEKAMSEYNLEKMDQKYAGRLYGLKDRVIWEAYVWMNELEQAYLKMRVKEILIIVDIRKMVSPKTATRLARP